MPSTCTTHPQSQGPPTTAASPPSSLPLLHSTSHIQFSSHHHRDQTGPGLPSQTRQIVLYAPHSPSIHTLERSFTARTSINAHSSIAWSVLASLRTKVNSSALPINFWGLLPRSVSSAQSQRHRHVVATTSRRSPRSTHPAHTASLLSCTGRTHHCHWNLSPDDGSLAHSRFARRTLHPATHPRYWPMAWSRSFVAKTAASLYSDSLV